MFFPFIPTHLACKEKIETKEWLIFFNGIANHKDKKKVFNSMM